MEKREAAIAAFKRFLRVLIPQIPALLAYLLQIKPEWAAGLSFAGAVVTALDKFLRAIDEK